MANRTATNHTVSNNKYQRESRRHVPSARRPQHVNRGAKIKKREARHLIHQAFVLAIETLKKCSGGLWCSFKGEESIWVKSDAREKNISRNAFREMYRLLRQCQFIQFTRERLVCIKTGYQDINIEEWKSRIFSELFRYPVATA